ncbi:MAG TPA: LemA family protein [Verrucomicrobiae bacterium]|jgi:LemA protein|nr:LemA family protein [Verrucomicrobiae bacterium]
MTGLGLGLMMLLGGLIVLFFVVMFVASAYNRLVSLRDRCRNAYVQIDAQLKRRYDLISNLVETAKSLIPREREMLESVTKARNIAYTAAQTAAANPGDATAMKNLGSAERDLTDTLSRLMVVSESSPDLKGNQNTRQLVEELTSTENKISLARQAYNESVTAYNTLRKVFPASFIAGIFNFAPAESFMIDKAKKEVPKTQF